MSVFAEAITASAAFVIYVLLSVFSATLVIGTAVAVLSVFTSVIEWVLFIKKVGGIINPLTFFFLHQN